MADVSHELGALRFVVDSPLSSKVAMFNNQAQQHKQGQLLNPFSNTDGRASSPKPQFAKDQYGKPLAGSLTEMRGQKANMHVMKEMVELCQIINSEGYNVKDEPTMRVIPFGELFNIYNYISDKVVGILLRARKYKFVEFEGEMLFQRRDDDVPIFLLRPIADIRHELEAKIEDIKRGASPAPQATSLLLDKSANEQRLKDLSLPNSQRNSKSRSQSPAVKSKGITPAASANASRSATPQPTATSNITAPASPVVVAAVVAAVAAATKPTDSSKPEQIASEQNIAPAALQEPATASNAVAVAANAANSTNEELPTIVIDRPAATIETTALEGQSTTAPDVASVAAPAAATDASAPTLAANPAVETNPASNAAADAVAVAADAV